MLGYSLSWYIFIFTLLELIIQTHLTFHDSSHGFISKNPRYFEDELSHIHEEISSLRYPRKNEPSAKLQLRFEPELLDFRQRSVGIPHSETVTLYNKDSNKSIDMTSISGNTVHFHSSFFEDKRIPPNGNTSFKVVFLGRQEGHVESNIFIHTSEGFMKYNVRAFGTFSKYRLRPIIGVKLPINSTFSPLIYMHNPHSEPIQIIEIYSSGGGFHLELPSGEQEGPNDLWEIPPQETKAVIRVRFQANVIQNHTAYVRIKLHKPDEILVVPLEVEVTSAVNVFHPQGYVDFGMGGDMDPPKEIKLCLFNPSKKPIRVHSVSTTSKSIKAQYYNIRISPGTEKENTCVHVGTLTVDWKTAWKMQDYHGKIVVKFRNGKNRTEIPYHLSVLKGGIRYDNMATTYFLNEKGVDLSMRTFEARNEFEYPIKVTNITFPFDAESIFKIETFTPKIIFPSERENLFNIKIKDNIKKTDMQLSSNIKLNTNISEMLVPLLSYNGKLTVHLPYKSEDYSLDAGLIGFNSKKEIYFMLTNPNPVTLHITSVRSSIPMTQVEVFGCGNGDHKLVLMQVSFKNLTKCHSIRSKHYVVIKMTVSTTQIEGQVWGDVQIETPLENLSVPVHFKISPGKLEIGPDRLVFDQCFPGKICSHPIRVHSTFNDKMTIENIITLPPDKRISTTHTGTILPRASRVVGHLFLNPDEECKPECYTGLQTDTSATWLKTFLVTKFVSEFDLHLVNVFYNRYLNLTSNGMKKWQNLTLRLDTSEVRGHIFKSRVKMSWPSLVMEENMENRSVLAFPLTQIGNVTYRSLVIHNPASYNVVVQLVFEKDYPHAQMLYDGLPSKFIPQSNEQSSSDHGFSFDEDWKKKQRVFFWDRMRVKVSLNSLALLLQPGQNQEVRVGFDTKNSDLHSSLLFIRNNLTILEVVRLRAQGAMPLFKFGNRKPGSVQPLLFEMTDRHMKDCERQKMFTNPQPNLTVKRTFTARNMGDVVVYINSFHINDYECEGYGFKVINCEPFELPPNGTKKIDIAFTPDLTLTKVTRTLILGTSLNIFVNYTLYTTIPPTYLDLCAELISRPAWEIYSSYVAVSLMIVLFFMIILTAVIDAERIKKQAMEAFIASNCQVVQPVLDLRKVGQQTREEIQSTREKKKEEKAEEEEDIQERSIVKEVEEEQVPVKTEPALIPATGKAKRKIAQKNSIEVEALEAEEEIQNEKLDAKERRARKKDILYERHRLKSRERRDEKELKMLEEKEKKEKHLQHKELKELKKVAFKKITKNTVVPGYEEETSSTTTESSSSNYEDTEKENQRVKFCSKGKPNNVKRDTLKSTETLNNLSDNSKHVSFINSKLKQHKQVQKTKDIDKQQPKDKEPEVVEKQEEKNPQHHHRYHTRENKKRENKVKERKEKLVYRNKNLNERKSKTSESEVVEKEKSKSPNSFYIPLPTPVTTLSIWGESRAKFSDVVARTEPLNNPEPSVPSSSSIRPLASAGQSKSNICKPTMYVEPYKATQSVELGPIGSRRTEVASDKNQRSPNEQNFDENFLPSCDNFEMRRDNLPTPLNITDYRSLNDRSIIAAISSNPAMTSDSFFTNTHDIRLDNGRDNSYMDEFALVSENWKRQQVFQNLVDPVVEEPEKEAIAPLKMEDPWNENLLNSSAYWSNSFGSVPNEPTTSTTNNPSNYLWGSNPVWQPWSPPVAAPGTPRKTPPGFDEVALRKQNEQQQRNSYSPFNSTGIWPPQQNNPWTYEDQQ